MNLDFQEKEAYKTPKSATLKDGSIIKVNDYVYIGPYRAGQIYQIGRIMNFHPSTSRKDRQITVSHLIRKFDTTQEYNAKDDPKLLFLTLTDEDIHLSHIIAKCTVTHISFINDIEAYRKLEDHFYFYQYYERYQSIIYDVLPTQLVANLPDSILFELRKRFSFVFCEKQEFINYQRVRKDCRQCGKWCQDPNNTLICMLCNLASHPECANPPVTKKLSKWFQYQCSTCLNNPKYSNEQPIISFKREEEPSGKAFDLLGLLAKPGFIYTKIKLRCSQGFPARYMGRFTLPEEAIEDIEPVYVRIPVPQGSKYQIELPDYEGQYLDDKSIQTNNNPNVNGVQNESNHQIINVGDHLDINSNNNTSSPIVPHEAIYDNNQTKQEDEEDLDKQLWPEEFNSHITFSANTLRKQQKTRKIMEKLESMQFCIPTHSLQFRGRAYSEIYKNNFDEDKVIEILMGLTAHDFGYQIHLADQNSFEKALLDYFPDFNKIAEQFPGMSEDGAKERFYFWKAELRKERLSLGPKFKKRAAKLMLIVYPDDIEYLESEDSDIDLDNRPKRQTIKTIKECLNCHEKDVNKFQRVPSFVTNVKGKTSIYCSPCANYLFRYGVPKSNDIITIKKKRGRRKEKKPNLNKVTQLGIKSSSSSSRQDSPMILQMPVSSPDISQPSSPNSVVSSPFTDSEMESLIDLINEPTFLKEDIVEIENQNEGHMDTSVEIIDHVEDINEHSHEEINILEEEEEEEEDKSIPMVFNLETQEHSIITCKACYGQSKQNILKCSKCKLKVHSECYLPNQDTETKWICNFCTNEKEMSHYKRAQCRICLKESKLQYDVLPTIEGNWVHINCFGLLDGLYLDKDNKVCGLNKLLKRQNSKCTSCYIQSGITLKCTFCNNNYHTNCAIDKNMFIGFYTGSKDTIIVCNNKHTKQLDQYFTAFKELDSNGNNHFQNKIKEALNRAIPQDDSNSFYKRYNSKSLDQCNRRYYNLHCCVLCDNKDSLCWWYTEIKPTSIDDLKVNRLECYNIRDSFKICDKCYFKANEKEHVDEVEIPCAQYFNIFSRPIKRKQVMELVSSKVVKK